MTASESLTPWELRTEATLASALWVLDGETRLPADAERRHALRAKLVAGELDELVFEACVFRAVYPNRNYLRFRDEDWRHSPRALSASRSCGITTPPSWTRGGDGAGLVVGRRRGESDAADRADRAARHRGVPESDDRSLLDRLVLDAPLCSVCGNEWLSRDCVTLAGAEVRRSVVDGGGRWQARGVVRTGVRAAGGERNVCGECAGRRRDRCQGRAG